MPLLETVHSPADLRRLDQAQIQALAAEIREFLVASVSRTGGHLGPNLGVVELTIALHRVFASPRDRIVFDTGHQAYVHKILTGRQDFSRLRQRGGLSGYPSQAESPHDLVENSHASTSLSYADGLAKAYALRGELDRRAVVAVIGDGALTGGMAWEALNTIAAGDRPVVVVVNDNGRSYAPTVGGLADRLASLRLNRNYERVLDVVKRSLSRTPVVGGPAYEALHGLKKGIKDVLQPQGLFEDLGLKYVGPIDGHDEPAVERALRRARAFGGPVVVHVVTRKGMGYRPAEEDSADNFHGIGVIDPETGLPVHEPAPTWTAAFAEQLSRIGEERADVVAITAAMLRPTGLDRFAAAFPDRVFDVGIAEQHAVTSAAGLAMGGMHPVVAVYATFLNRAFDQVLMDVALHRLPVTFVLDRAGITGDDGPSHNGMWDLALLGLVPGLRLAAPRDGATLRRALAEAVDHSTGPTAVRFPKGSLPADRPALRRVGPVDVLAEPGPDAVADVLVVGVGPFAALATEVATRVAGEGISTRAVDPRWPLPVPAELVGLAPGHRLVVVVEDGVRAGGVATHVEQALRDAGCPVPVLSAAIPDRFLEQGSRTEVLADCGLTAQDVARDVVGAVARLTASDDPLHVGQV